MIRTSALTLASIVALSSPAAAQIGGFAYDGILNTNNPLFNEFYGEVAVVQTASVIAGTRTFDVTFSANVDNSNVGGIVGFDLDFSPVFPDMNGQATDILTGLEFSLPLAELGWDGTSPIKVTGFVTGGNFVPVSNQVIGLNPANTNQVGDANTVNFADEARFPGDQFVIASAVATNPAIAVDGVLEIAEYPAPAWIQTGPTSFGNNTHPGPGASFSSNAGTDMDDSDDVTGGSEFNAVYLVRDDLGTAETEDDVLYVMITGNFETNFNRLVLLFDVAETLQLDGDTTVNTNGQRTLSTSGFNPDINFNQLNTTLGGMTFDNPFAANYILTLDAGNVIDLLDPENGTPADFSDDSAEGFANGAVLVTEPIEGEPAAGGFLGSFRLLVDDTENPGSFLPGQLDAAGPNGGGNILAAINNANVSGTTGNAPIGVDVIFPTTDNTLPAEVSTGIELSIDIADLGWDGITQPAIVGMIINGGGDVVSNQVFGGLPADTAGLGFPSAVNFDQTDTERGDGIPGDQFLVVTQLTGTPATIDGINDSNDAYAAPLWVNDTNASGNSTGFGNNSDPSPTIANGSELNNVSAYVDSNGVLHIHAAGNLHDFNRLLVGVDIDGTAPGDGQNRILGGNFNVGNVFANFQEFADEGNGMQFDVGIDPDAVLLLSVGVNANGTAEPEDDFPESFLDVGSLPTDPTDEQTEPVGGFVGGGEIIPANFPVVGTGSAAFGFGDNQDPSDAVANGSELNALYAAIDRGTSPNRLALMLTGNLQTNFNRLVIFLDTDVEQGQNPINPNLGDQANPVIDLGDGALARMGQEVVDGALVADGPPGLTFEDDLQSTPISVFSPTHILTVTAGNVREVESVDPFTSQTSMVQAAEIFANFAVLTGVDTNLDETQASRFLGSTLSGFDSPGVGLGDGILSGGDNDLTETIRINLNNSNVGGVVGDTVPFGDVSDAQNVMTGIEIGIPLDQLAPWDPTTTPIRIYAHIADEAYGFVSNQTLPGSCAFELGEVRDLDHNDISGAQFVELRIASEDPSETLFFVNNFDNLPEPCTGIVDDPVPCPGDTNDDFRTDATDFFAVIQFFGVGTTVAQGNFDGDAVTDADDFFLVIQFFGCDNSAP